MVKPPAPIWSGLLLLATAAFPPGPAFALAADGSPDAVLKEKGLKRSGNVYVLPTEAEVQKKLNSARSLYQYLNRIAAQKEAFEQTLQENQAQLREMEQQRVLLNQQIAQGPPPQIHNQIVASINALTGQMKLLQGQTTNTDAQQVPGARLASSREEFMQAVLDLRILVDKVKADYTALAKDEAVQSALASLNANTKDKKPRYTLGPSKTFLANEAQLARAEANVLTEDVALRNEGGVHWLDVTFNGKVTRPMIFDTGASTVVLPAELADAIGLKPGPNDRMVTSRVADGSEVEARKTIIPSIRVGKFTIENVECVVMPATKKNVPPLLGQSFHKHFTYKFSADSGKLVLARVETTGTATPAATRPKAKAVTKGGRGRRSTRPTPSAGAEDK